MSLKSFFKKTSLKRNLVIDSDFFFFFLIYNSKESEDKKLK